MSAHILVVDDVPLNLEVLVAMLARDYPVVSTAADGSEALAKIEDEKPHIVLLDVMMPGLNGFDTCRRIKADPATAHIPVVMVTALSRVDDLVRGFESDREDMLKGMEAAPGSIKTLYSGANSGKLVIRL